MFLVSLANTNVECNLTHSTDYAQETARITVNSLNIFILKSLYKTMASGWKLYTSIDAQL